MEVVVVRRSIADEKETIKVRHLEETLFVYDLVASPQWKRCCRDGLGNVFLSPRVAVELI